MQELIKIQVKWFGEKKINAVDGRELHGFLGVETRFNDWMDRRIKEYKFVINSDFCSWMSKSSGGRPSTEYTLSLNMAKELCMVEKNEKGKQAREYFIECEDRANAIQVPQTEAERILDVVLLLQNTVEKEKALRLEAERTKHMIGDKKVATALVTASHAVRRANKAEAVAEEARLEAEKAKEAEKKYKRRALKFANLSDDLEEEVDKLKAKLEEVTIKEETFKAVTAIPWLKNYFLKLDNLTLQQIGRTLSSISRKNDLEMGEVSHERFGSAKTYHPKAISKFKMNLDADSTILGNYRK